MGDAIVLKYEISPDDFTRAGEASSDVKGKLKQLGVSPEAVRKVAIAMSQLIWTPEISQTLRPTNQAAYTS